MKPAWKKKYREWSRRVMDVCYWVNLALCLVNLYRHDYEQALYNGFFALFCWATGMLLGGLPEEPQ